MRFAVAASIAAIGVVSVAAQTPVTYEVTDATYVYQYTAVEIDGEYTSDALITSTPVAGGAAGLTTTTPAVPLATTPATTPLVAPVTTTAAAAATTTRQPGVSDASHNDNEEATGWSVGRIIHDAYELKHVLGARDPLDHDEKEGTHELHKRQQGAALGGGGGNAQLQQTGLQQIDGYTPPAQTAIQPPDNVQAGNIISPSEIPGYGDKASGGSGSGASGGLSSGAAVAAPALALSCAAVAALVGAAVAL